MWAHKCLIKGKITLFDLLAAIMAIQPCLISNKTGGVLIFRHSLFDCFGMLTDGAAHICCGQSSCSAQGAIPLSTSTAFPLHPTFLGHFHSFFPLTPHFTGCTGSKCCPFPGEAPTHGVGAQPYPSKEAGKGPNCVSQHGASPLLYPFIALLLPPKTDVSHGRSTKGFLGIREEDIGFTGFIQGQQEG